jgi:hypothetical protein
LWWCFFLNTLHTTQPSSWPASDAAAAAAAAAVICRSSPTIDEPKNKAAGVNDCYLLGHM